VPAPGISFAALQYCAAVANAARNLNVTTWRVNAVGKGKLVVKFLDRRWDFLENVRTGGLYTAEKIATECSVAVQRVLNKSLADGSCVRTRIGRTVRDTMRFFIAPALLDPPGFWREEERDYLRALLSVLAHMCLTMWPEGAAGDEEADEEEDPAP
jgi:hypothetical protein